VVPLDLAVPRLAKALLVAACLLLVARTGGAEGGRYAIGTDEYTISYRPSDAAQAQAADAGAKEALERLKRAFGLKRLPELVRMEICHDRAELARSGGDAVTPWTEGLAFPAERRILLLRVAPRSMGKLVGHELCHVVLYERLAEAGAEAPRWLHEGLAKYSSDDFTSEDRSALGEAASDGKLLGLADLDDAFAGDPTRVQLAYAESYTLVEFLVELDPDRGVAKLLTRLGETRDVGRALRLAYGLPAEALEQSWLQSVRTNYLTASYPPIVEMLILATMGVLAIFMIMVRWHLRLEARGRISAEERMRPVESSEDAPPAEDRPEDGSGSELWYT
jgi:hypothetical protein